MDIKSIVLDELTKQVEATVPKMQDGIETFIIEKIQSEEFEKEWATAINDKVNLPLLNEEQEQKVFEELVDKGTDLVAVVLTRILKGK